MKNLVYIAFLVTVASCNRQGTDGEETTRTKVTVEVAGMTIGSVRDDLTLLANTMYLKRNVVTAPIASFVTDVQVSLGQAVKKGQLLYTLETKERRAIGNLTSPTDSISALYGRITIKAPASGIISTLDKQQIGDYVLEGAQLCTLAESNDIAFAVNVPFEYSRLTKPGVSCLIVLPDNSIHHARFSTPLTTMNSVAQTQTVLAKATEPLFLPENLIVKVVVSRGAEAAQQVLPRSALLTDEMMEHFWVMRLYNDTTAIRVDVTPGSMNKDSVEIASPKFEPDDQFLISGNYGIPDTTYVEVKR